MRRTRPAVLLGAFGIGAIAGALLLWLPSGGGPPIDATPDEIPPAPEAATIRAAGRGRGPARAAISGPDENIAIKVVDAEEKPISNASIMLVQGDGGRRAYEVAELLPVGFSDEAGELRLRELPDGWSMALVAHEEYEAVGVNTSTLAHREVTTIVLPAGASLRVSCSTRAGQPVAKARVLVSQGPLSWGDWVDHHLVPGPGTAEALFKGESDESGHVVLSGLPIGPMRFLAEHDSSVLVEGWPRGGLVLRPGLNDVGLRFDPIVGIAAEVVGDDVIDYELDVPEAVAIPALDPSFHRRLGAIRSRVSNGVCILLCPVATEDGSYRPTPRSIDVPVLTSGRGWIDVRCSVRRYSDLISPEIIDVSAVPPSGAMCDVFFDVRDPDGQQVMLQSLHAKREDARLGRPVEVGEWSRLPSGTYEIVATNRFIDRAISPRTIEVHEGVPNNVTLQLSQSFAPVRFELRDEAGAAVDSGVVKLIWGSVSQQATIGGDATPLIPRDLVSGTVYSPGCVEKDFELDARSGKQSEVVLSVTLARKQ